MLFGKYEVVSYSIREVLTFVASLLRGITPLFWPKMAASLALGFPLYQCAPRKSPTFSVSGAGDGGGVFPSFLPEEVNKIRDPSARTLAQRIERLPVQVYMCV